MLIGPFTPPVLRAAHQRQLSDRDVGCHHHSRALVHKGGGPQPKRRRTRDCPPGPLCCHRRRALHALGNAVAANLRKIETGRGHPLRHIQACRARALPRRLQHLCRPVAYLSDRAPYALELQDLNGSSYALTLLRTRWGIPTVKINGTSANPDRWPDGTTLFNGWPPPWASHPKPSSATSPAAGSRNASSRRGSRGKSNSQTTRSTRCQTRTRLHQAIKEEGIMKTSRRRSCSPSSWAKRASSRVDRRPGT